MALPDRIQGPAQVSLPAIVLLAFSKMAPEFLSDSMQSGTKFCDVLIRVSQVSSLMSTFMVWQHCVLTQLH